MKEPVDPRKEEAAVGFCFCWCLAAWVMPGITAGAIGSSRRPLTLQTPSPQGLEVAMPEEAEEAGEAGAVAWVRVALL